MDTDTPRQPGTPLFQMNAQRLQNNLFVLYDIVPYIENGLAIQVRSL